MPSSSEVSNDALATHVCGPDDRAEQARLFNACFRKTLGPETLAWRYDENPHGQAVSLVSRPPGGEGVCGYACSPRIAIPWGDVEHAAVVGQTGDVMTHPEWRKRGIFSSLDVACMEQIEGAGWSLAFGLPNRRSAHIFVRDLGWEEIGQVRPWTFVLRSDAPARKARRADGRLRALLTPLDRVVGGRARHKLRARAGRGLEVRPLREFPAEVGELCEEVSKDFSLMVRRDADYLDWRFLGNTSGLHRAYGVYARDEGFRGYVIVQLPRPDSPIAYLVDVLAADDAALAAGIEGAFCQLSAAGASLVQATAIDGTWWQQRLQEAGFKKPRPENCLIVILHPQQKDHPLVAAARDIEHWYFTDGDRDDETMG